MASDNKKVSVEKRKDNSGSSSRVKVGNKEAGYSSDNYGVSNVDRAYVRNNDTGNGAWAGRNNYDGRNTYFVGADLPQSVPDGRRDFATPVGNFAIGNSYGDGAYAEYESPIRRGITNLPDGTVVNDMNYSTPNGFAYANRENYPDGNVGFTMGYERNGVNAPETWNERETPLGTIGYGSNGSGYSAFYEPNSGIQDAYAKLVSLLGGR